LLPEVKENVSLAKYTTFKIGGPARYFYLAKTKEELIKGIGAALRCEPPFFILGGGSNILVADEGYKGIVIKFQNPNFKIQIKSKFQNPKIHVEACVPLSLVVSEMTENNLSGLEWAAGIPGTVGGAIYGNAGSFGGSMSDVVKNVEVLEIQVLKNQKLKIKNKKQILNVKKLKNKKCGFGYRDSIFKKNKNLIILSAILQLEKGNRKEIKNKIRENLRKRNKAQPLNFLSAGSIFKNFIPYRPANGGTGPGTKLSKELKEFKKTGIIPAAWLIEKCGLKGKKIGKAQVSKKHSNFIVNLGGAKAGDVKKLIDFIKKKVKNKFRTTLKEEICFLGFYGTRTK